MKQKAAKKLIILLMVICAPMLFVACTDKKIKLDSPVINLVTSDNEMYVEATTVENANGYRFEVNGVPFFSETERFDLKDIIIEYKSYSIKAYAIGSGNFTNSSQSNTVMFNHKQQFTTPILNINNTTLKWTAISNASTYILKINQTEIELQQTTIDFKENELVKDLINLNQNNTFSVKVKSTLSIKESDYSNTVNYSEVQILSSPFNLKVVADANKNVKLTWLSEYTNKNFNIYEGNTLLGTTSELSFDVTEYLTQAREYFFNVETVSESQNVSNSEKTPNVSYVNQVALEAPKIENIYLTEYDEIVVELSEVENGSTYTIQVNENLTFETNSNKLLLTANQLAELETETFSFCAMANGYNNYVSSMYGEQYLFNPYSQLATPTLVKIIKNNNITYLSFKAVEDAKQYNVKINDDEFVINSTYVDISNYALDTKEYNITVQSKGYGFFKDSEVSEAIIFNQTYILNTPQNLNLSVVNGILTAYWDNVSNALSYNIMVENNLTSYSVQVETNTYEFNLHSGGVYIVCVQAIGDNEKYFNSEYSLTNSISYVKKLSVPANFEYDKGNSLITFSWNPVVDAQNYELIIGDEIIQCVDTNYKIPLKYFEFGEYICKIKALATESDYYQSSEYSTLLYNHGSQENQGEVYSLNGKEKDFFIEGYEELKDIIDFSYKYKKSTLTFYDNFNYEKDLTSAHFYPQYQSILENYKQSDKTIRNEILSCIIELGYVDNMKLILVTSLSEQVKLTFEYSNYKVEKVVSGSENVSINKDFKAYTSGTRITGAACQQMPTLPSANTINTSEMLYETIVNGNKPLFESSIEGNQIAEYYNTLLKVLNSNISKNANDYQKALVIFDYLVANTVYDFNCESYITENNITDYNLYYSYNVDGVVKHSKATSVGLAKTFAMMCSMEGIEANYHIAKKDNKLIGYNTIKIENTIYAVDFVNSIFISDKMNSKKQQYFTHNYFLNNLESLTYISSTQESYPNAATPTGNIDYFSNFEKNTGNCNLVIQDIDTATEVVTYCANKNMYALEVKLTMNKFMFEMGVKAIIAQGTISSYSSFEHGDTMFIKITL